MAKKLSGCRVLITGAGGFIGSHLTELCLAEGAEVRAFVRYNSRNDWGMLEMLGPGRLREVEVVAGNLLDFETVRRAVRSCEYVFHLGALIGIPYSYVSAVDVIQTNVIGTMNVLQACLDSGVRRLVHTSTSEVYGSAQFVPMDESHPLNPQSPYAASKLAADKLAESYHRSFDLPVTILRPFNSYGPRQSARAIIPTIITQALCSDTIRLGSITPTRDLTYVEDTARAFIAAAERPACRGATVQVGSQVETSIGELVEMVARILGKRIRIQSQAQRRRPEASEVQRLVAKNERARKLLGWRPRVSLRDGLERTVRWFRDASRNYKHEIYHV